MSVYAHAHTHAHSIQLASVVVAMQTTCEFMALSKRGDYAKHKFSLLCRFLAFVYYFCWQQNLVIQLSAECAPAC